MLKVIFFDIDNTLLSFDEYVKESMKNGFAKYQLCGYKDEMFSVFNRINNTLWQGIEKGEMNFEELRQKRWNLIFEELGISFDGFIFEEYFGKCLFESAIPEKGALELLEYLYGKYTLCITSNGPYLQQVNRLKISGMLPYFSHLFISEEIGSSKPSEDFFRTCLERLNFNMPHEIKPHEIMIVGDSISSDMIGGMEFGMKTCFYNSRKESLPSGRKVDYEVTLLEEIRQFA